MKRIVVMPAYNAEQTLEKTIANIPKGSVDEIILVDDCSKDGTVALARKLGLTVILHQKNRGYGGNQKTCYQEALKRGADIVIMIHPDYQYDPRLTPVMTSLIEHDICDVVLGNRIRTRREALDGGMPLYKYIANRFLTALENSVTGENLGEWHSGLRAYSRKVLETIRWEDNSDDFVFDQEFLIQAAVCRFRLGDVPVAARYFEEASSINFRRSVIYGLSTLGVLAKYLAHRSGLRKFKQLLPQEKNA
jgi:glycosyltransferase involved in cell wall biosynthesis